MAFRTMNNSYWCPRDLGTPSPVVLGQRGPIKLTGYLNASVVLGIISIIIIITLAAKRRRIWCAVCFQITFSSNIRACTIYMNNNRNIRACTIYMNKKMSDTLAKASFNILFHFFFHSFFSFFFPYRLLQILRHLLLKVRKKM